MTGGEGFRDEVRLFRSRMTARRRSIRFTAVLEESRNKLWGAHLGIPDALAAALIAGGSHRVLCTLNGTAEYPTALMPRGDGSFVIRVNKKFRATLGLQYGDRVEVALQRDESQYGLPMPEELSEALRQDREVHELFHSLSAGRRRTLLYLVGSAKGVETRIHRAVTVVRHLRANQGKVNYRELYAALRRNEQPTRDSRR